MADAPDSIEKCIADLREELAGGGPTGCWQCLGSVADRLEAMLAAPPSPPVAAPSQLEQDLDDLATLVRRLARHLRKVAPDAELANQAVGYLERKGFNASPFRGDPAPQPPRPGTAPLSDARLLIGKIVNRHGDPEAFAERELQIDGDIQKLPIGTRVYVDRAARVLTRAGHQTMHEAMLDGAEIVSRGHPTTPTPKD